MKIFIKKLRFQTIIGILDFERVEPQMVELNATLTCKDEPMLLDYAQIAQFVKDLFTIRQFQTVEEALEVLHAELKKSFNAIQSAKISLYKVEILPDCIVGAKLEKKY